MRASTKAQYQSKMRVFKTYCDEVGVGTTDCSTNVVLNFFTELVRGRGLGYQTVCGYRSAIARQHVGVGGVPLGQLPAIRRLTRAIFVERPPLPRYSDIWDVDRVLGHLEAMPAASELSLMDLTIKTASLAFIMTLSRFITNIHQL